jgi:hypothetical protein
LIDLNVLFSFASMAPSQCYMSVGFAESLSSKMGWGVFVAKAKARLRCLDSTTGRIAGCGWRIRFVNQIIYDIAVISVTSVIMGFFAMYWFLQIQSVRELLEMAYG